MSYSKQKEELQSEVKKAKQEYKKSLYQRVLKLKKGARQITRLCVKNNYDSYKVI